jgi:hypothetical protein
MSGIPSSSSLLTRRSLLATGRLMKTVRAATGVALIIAGVLAGHAGRGELSGAGRIDLQRHDLSAPGREVIEARVEVDPAVASARYSPPGEEIIPPRVTNGERQC